MLSSFFGPEFITLTLVSLLAAITPGPDFALVVRNGVIYSRKIALYTAIGVSLGLFFHVSYILLGLGCMITGSSELMMGIKYAGASYLLFLGVKSLLKPQLVSPKDMTTSDQNLSTTRSLRMGFFNNLVNLQSALFLMSLFAIIITPSTPLHIQMGYGLWRIFLSLVWFVCLALFITHPAVKSRLLAMGPFFKIIMGLILCFLALRVFLLEPQSLCPPQQPQF